MIECGSLLCRCLAVQDRLGFALDRTHICLQLHKGAGENARLSLSHRLHGTVAQLILHMEDDIICPYGEDGRKFILADSFGCWDEGEYMGQVSKETIAKMPKAN